MTKMKKLLALCLSILMIISALPLTAGAAEEVIKFRAGYKKGSDKPNNDLYDGYADIPFTITNNGVNQANGDKTGINQMGSDTGATIIMSNKTPTLKINYEITTSYDGIYKLDVESSFYGSNETSYEYLHVYVDDKEIAQHNAVYAGTSSTGYGKFPEDGSGWSTVAYIYAKAGVPFVLSFNNPDTDGTGKGTINLRDIILTLQPDPTFDGVSIGATVNKSTDVITLDYSAEVTAKNAEVTLKTGDEELDITTKVNEADNTKLDIILNESLNYENDYTLSFSNITMASGFVFDEENTVNFSVPAKAEDESAKTDTLVIDSLELDELTFTLEGTVTGSASQAIKGREVNASFVFPVSKETKSLDPVETDADGKFAFTYTLTEEEADAEGGLYEFTAETEFAEAKADSVRYISAEERKAVLGTLESKTTAEEVNTFFTTDNEGLNDDILGVDISALNDKFADKVNDFYKRLADAEYKVNDEYTLEAFNKVWEDAYVLEDINFSDSDDVTASYINKEAFRKATGIDEEKFALLNTQKSAFVTAVTGLESQKTMADFGKAVNELFNDFLALEFGKSDLTLTLADASVYVGQSAYVDLELTAKAKDIKGYTIKVKCPADEAAETIGLETENGSVSKAVDGKVATFTVTDVKGELEALGKLTYSSSSEASYTIAVDGAVVYEVSKVEINCVIAKDEADISVKKNSGKSQSSSSSSFTSGGSSASTVVKPIVKEDDVNQIGDGFTDLGGVEWAQDSIDYLYKKGIISEAADGRFRPNDSVTRAEFVKMLVGALRITDKSAQVKLSDVSQSDWYYEYVSSAVSYGLVLGDEKGNFRPNDKITRQDICVIISRAMDKLGYGKADAGQLFYDDAQISAYAKDAVYRMRTHGIVNGTGDGGFAPLSDATRAATAKIIYAFMKEANI